MRITLLLLIATTALFLNGCCGHASWGDKYGWQCHDFDNWNNPRGPSTKK